MSYLPLVFVTVQLFKTRLPVLVAQCLPTLIKLLTMCTSVFDGEACSAKGNWRPWRGCEWRLLLFQWHPTFDMLEWQIHCALGKKFLGWTHTKVVSLVWMCLTSTVPVEKLHLQAHSGHTITGYAQHWCSECLQPVTTLHTFSRGSTPTNCSLHYRHDLIKLSARYYV